MGEVISLKKACLEVGPENAANRYHALEVFNYIEKIENLVVIDIKPVYNGISYGDMAVLDGKV